MPPPGPLVYDVVFPINSSDHVLRPEEGDIGCVTVRLEVPAGTKIGWSEIKALASSFAQQRILNMVAPGGGIGPGKVTSVLTGTEERPSEAKEVSGHTGVFVCEVSIQRHKPPPI
jgi:hypothetical protein